MGYLLKYKELKFELFRQLNNVVKYPRKILSFGIMLKYNYRK